MTQQLPITKYDNILVQEDIEYILNLQEVQQAKKDIDSLDNGKIYFSIDLPPQIREKLSQTFNINVSKVPMRWIKGDTPPHEDKGASSFENTYLIYLTDSQGSFIVDGNTYPITQNTGYVFSEGLQHETTGTGSEPRLLLGPMNEQGFVVGAITSISGDGGTTIYIRQLDPSGNLQYSVNNQSSWIDITNFPVYISNSDTAKGVLSIEFLTDIFISNSSVYFVCNSDKIQFGKSSLKSDGSRPIINIEDVNAYPGFIENGSLSVDGYSNIYVYNLEIRSTGVGNTYLLDGAGWIGQSNFGKGSSNNYIINCRSVGDIPTDGGGIVGVSSGGYIGGSLTIIGCSSNGEIGYSAGGIAGRASGESFGSITCEKCWSEGVISPGEEGGGIFGSYAGQNRGSATANKCYSTNTISFNSGGIFGSYAGDSIGSAIADTCYSNGNIGIGAGGIFGTYAGNAGGTTTAVNCYSTGIINTDAGGIYGRYAGPSVPLQGLANAFNCYSSGSITTVGNGIYGSNKSGGTENNCNSSNGFWVSGTAATTLTGTPQSIIGNSWISKGINQPYELNNFGYTPYTISNINILNNSLIQSFSQNINAGTSTITGIVSGLSYQILDISHGGTFGSFPTITINNTTGQITTTTGTVQGLYTIFIRSGNYSITQFNLTVNPTNEFSQLLLLLILLKNRRNMILGHTYNRN